VPGRDDARACDGVDAPDAESSADDVNAATSADDVETSTPAEVVGAATAPAVVEVEDSAEDADVANEAEAADDVRQPEGTPPSGVGSAQPEDTATSDAVDADNAVDADAATKVDADVAKEVDVDVPSAVEALLADGAARPGDTTPVRTEHDDPAGTTTTGGTTTGGTTTGGTTSGATTEDATTEDATTEAAATEVATAGDLVPDPADAARVRLFRALRPRASRGQLLAAVICAVLGFAVVVQVRQAQEEGLSALRQTDLVTVLDNVTQQSARLDDQAAALQKTLDDLQSASDRSPAARAAAQQRLDVLGVLAGTQGAVGPGIELDITDPKGQVNATDVLGAVEELRDAGGEAIQIGPVRVVASTAFVDDPHGVFVDRTLVTAPFRMLVIGDPQTLGAALEIPGGVLESLRSKGADGAVHPEQTLRITALRQVSAPQYARPASPAAP
jgi:uncharacterized protein YlxW (UPF0749 family)